MKLLERDGKKILRDAGIAAPREFVFPAVVKPQILSGRRGERGLIRHIQSEVELTEDERGKKFLCEEFIVHEKEFYIACTIDRAVGDYQILFSEVGGGAVTPADMTTNIPEKFSAIARALLAAAKKNDATLIEINPLVEVAGTLIALDAKVELDDAAAARHPEWALYKQSGITPKNILLDGNIACIFFGGGASLLALDALFAAGARPANFTEISGNPSYGAVRAIAAQVLSAPKIIAVWIAGSHANFTNVFETVRAVLAAYEVAKLSCPIIIRRDGPLTTEAENYAFAWAERNDIKLIFDRIDISFSESAKLLI